VLSVAFDPRGVLLAAGGSDGTALLWSPTTHQSQRLVVSHTRPVKSVAFSPSGDSLAAASGRSVVLFNVALRKAVGHPIAPGDGTINSVSFKPHKRDLLALATGRRVVLWDIATGRRAGPDFVGTSNILYSIAFSPDGQTLAAGGASMIELWQTSDHRPIGHVTGPRGAVYSVAFSRGGRMLASAGADWTIRIWHFPIGQQFGEPLGQYHGPVSSVAISSLGTTIASVGSSGRVYLYDRATGGLLRVMPSGLKRVDAIAFAPNGRALAVAGAANTHAIRLLDVATGQMIARLPVSGAVLSVAFNSDGSMLVSGGTDRVVRLWNVATGKQSGELAGHRGAVYTVAFNPAGTEVASGSADRTVQLWNVRTQKGVQTIAQPDAVFGLAFSPNGRMLASGGADATVRLWQLKKGRFVPALVLTGDTGLVRSVAFSPDGRTLASASSDRTIRVWDVASGSEIGEPLTGDTASVESVVFSRDGQFLVSGSDDGAVRLWRAINTPPSFGVLRTTVCDFLGADLSNAEWQRYARGITYQRSCPRITPTA
jgi:WD40 repeat protein